MGESRREAPREVEALRLGISLGLTLIDTAELYGAGGAERVVGEAIRDVRDKVFLVTKVWPSHAGYEEVLRAVRASLQRLRTDYVDAVLLHWPTKSVPLAETVRAFLKLREEGLIRYFGVSNFDRPWLEQLARCPGGAEARFNQIPYSLADRRAERHVLSHCRTQGCLVMAYSPLGHGRMESWPGFPALREVAARHGATPAQVALAWLAHQSGVVAIPKAVRPEHVRENAAAGSLTLTAADLQALDRAFPVPARPLRPDLPTTNLFFATAFGALQLWARVRR